LGEQTLRYVTPIFSQISDDSFRKRSSSLRFLFSSSSSLLA
jgi:hypothetical protein